MNLDKIFNQIDTKIPLSKNGLKIRDIKWNVQTAGPSPDNNNRVELFFLGCMKAVIGTPCKGCFNSSTWYADEAQWNHDPILLAQHINNNAPNKYITIGGGEPTDQLDNLIILCRELKKYDFHIIIYTWRKLISFMDNDLEFVPIDNINENNLKDKINELLNYVDIIIDGQYIEELKVWNPNKKDGLYSSVGSKNQILWDIKKYRESNFKDSINGHYMKYLKSLYLDENNNLIYKL